MNLKPTQRPVARPTAEPKPKKLSAKERRIAASQAAPPAETNDLIAFVTYGNHKEPERDSPKVKAARRVLDQMSESLAPEGALLMCDTCGHGSSAHTGPGGECAECGCLSFEGEILPPAPNTPLRMDSEPSKVCSYHKRPEPLTAFASNAAHGDGLQSACREADKIRRDARKPKAGK